MPTRHAIGKMGWDFSRHKDSSWETPKGRTGPLKEIGGTFWGEMLELKDGRRSSPLLRASVSSVPP